MDGKTFFQPARQEDTAALHNGWGNYGHTDTQSHAQVFLHFYNEHPADEAESL